jgi:RNA polymerase sigma factor (sigma-70 family)
MKLIVHNKHLIGPKEIQKSFEEELAKKIRGIENALSRYSKSPALEIFVSMASPGLFRIAVSLKLKSKLLYAEEKGDKPLSLINFLMDKLRANIRKYVVLERREHTFKRKLRRTETFGEFAHKLDELFAEKEHDQFRNLIQQALPSVRQYALRLLNQKHSRKSGLTNEDILQEVYLALFERFGESPTDPSRRLAWCYKVTSETIDKIIRNNTETAHKKFDTHAAADRELSSLREKMTANAEGEPILYDDLDDISYRNTRYGPEILPEKNISDYLEYSEEDAAGFHEQVQEILQTCDSFERHVFEMYWLDELTEEQIAESNRINAREVREIIDSVTKRILAGLKQTKHDLQHH